MTRQAEAELINACCNPPDVCDALRTGRRLDDRFHACRVQSAQVVRYKPGKRCLIKYVGRDAAGTQFAFLGKVRFKGLDRRTPALQRALWATGWEGGGPFCVPRVCGELPSLNMWLQEFIEDATPCRVESADFVSQQARVAELLARLHRTPLSPAKHHTPRDEMRLLEARLSQLDQDRPAWRRRIDAVRIATRRIADRLAVANPLTTIHRDFYPDQVLVSRSRTVLLDLDLCCVGPPELDVGNYIGHLREYAIRFPVHRSACALAEREFTRACMEMTPGLSPREVESWAILTLARHISLSTQLPGRGHTTCKLVEATLTAFATHVSEPAVESRLTS